MLAAFLAGLALGSIVPATRRLAWVDRLKDPLVWFGLIQVAIAATVTLLTPVLDRLPLVFVAFCRWFGPRFWALQLAGVAMSFLVMLPAAGLMGFAFPLVTRLATERLGALGRRLSSVYAANTFGTVVGSFAAGFILIPMIGARHALAVGVLLNTAIGVAYLMASLRRQRILAGAGIGLSALTAVAWVAMPDWNRYLLSAGAYVYAENYLAGNARAIMEDKELLYYRDALTATLSVTRIRMPGHPEPILGLQINGKTDASTDDLCTQLMLGHLPALLARDPRTALTIGLASGCTLGALQQHPGVQRIDCVEIEPAMPRATDFFRHINRNCLDDPRVRLFLYDARNFVLVSREQYSVLISEPSNPWIAGMANLFTLEHFRLCRDRLAPDGIVCQWVPIYNLAPTDFRSIVATFQSVFPNSSLWIFPDVPSDAYFVATQSPLRIDAVELARRAARPEIAADLAQAGLRDAWDLLGGHVFGPEMMAAIAEGQPLNTDDFPRLEFSSPLRLYSASGRQPVGEILAYGAGAQVPLERWGTVTAEGYRSALSGLLLSAPWKVREEGIGVTRDLSPYLGRTEARRVQSMLRIACDLEGDPADILVARPGELGDPDGEPLEPPTQPDRTMRAAGHDASVWLAPPVRDAPAWLARWLCLEHERVYLVRAWSSADKPALPPERALAGLRCHH